jgi:hypothetical protein
VLLSTVVISTTGGAVPSLLTASVAPQPHPAGEQYESDVYGMSCTSAGNCIAVGRYTTFSRELPIIWVETGGTWAVGPVVSLPTASGAGPAELRSVRCASAGNCVAVGDYTDSSSRTQSMVVTESGGVWGKGAEYLSPWNGTTGTSQLYEISCASAGNCTAVGTSTDLSSNTQSVTLTESSGTWGTETALSMPSGAATDPYPDVRGISCWSAGECVVVGSYQSSSSDLLPFTATESSGVFAGAVEVTPPAGGVSPEFARLDAISCPSAGECTAVGIDRQAPSTIDDLEVVETGGVWGAAQVVTDPQSGDGLEAISCVTPGVCTAAGTTLVSSDTQIAVVASTSSSTFGSSTTIPANSVATGPPTPTATSIVCVDASTCTLVGLVRGTNSLHAFVTSSSGSVFGAMVLLPEPSAIGVHQSGQLTSVSCVSSTYCVAVGNYLTPALKGGDYEATYSNGVWTAQPLTPPSLQVGEDVLMTGVSCKAVGQCEAVGNVDPTVQGVTFNEVGGMWSQGALLPVSGTTLQSVSCATSTWCLAVGDDGAAVFSSGSWSQVTPPQVVVAPYSGQPPVLTSVGCWATRACTSIGWFYDQATTHHEDLTIGYTSGGFGTPQMIAPPANVEPNGDFSELDGVSCPSAGNCLAAGISDYQPQYAVETGGTWQTAAYGAMPSGAKYFGGYGGVSCANAANCLITGSWQVTPGINQGLFGLGSASSAPSVETVRSPSITSSPTSQNSALAASSCPTATFCLAVGFTSDAAGQSVPMFTTTTPAPGAVTGLKASKVTSSSVTLTWKAPVARGAGQLVYSISESVNKTTWTTPRTTRSLSVTFKSLKAKKTYHFRVRSQASDGQKSPYAQLTVKTT